MRRLIINADDFGLTSGVNRAIVQCHEKGVVTSATLMANAPGFGDAIRLSRSAPRLALGCHIVLVDGSPVLAGNEIPSLLARSNQQSRFPESFAEFAMRAVRGRLSSAEIEREARAQIGRLQSEGVQVTHVDTHKHTHIFPQVLEPLLEAASACGVHAVRNPFGPVGMLKVSRPKLWIRWMKVAAIQSLAQRFREVVTKAGMVTPDGTVGIVSTGSLDKKLFTLVVEHLPEGTWEFVCHPGYNDADLARVRTRLHESRERELRILTSEWCRDLLAREQITLISYRELEERRVNSSDITQAQTHLGNIR